MNFLRALIVATVWFGVDRASKWWVVEHFGLPSLGSIHVFPGLNLTMAWNHGVNFGLFSSQSEWARFGLTAFAAIAAMALLVWAARSPHRIVALAAGTIAGGALGNVYDRLSYGAVADFLNVSCCGINNPYAFNIADVAIFLGAGLLILFSPSGDKNKRQA